MTETECVNGRSVPRIVIALVLLAVVPEVLLTVVGDLQSEPGLPGWRLAVDIAAGAAGCAMLPILLRAQTVPAYLLALLSAIAPAATPPAAFAILYVARWRRFGQAAPVTAAVVAAHLVRWHWWPFSGLPFGWWALLVAAAAAALLGWGTFGRARAELLESYRGRALRAEAEQARRVAEARASERARIAREMHDVLAHRLTLVVTYAGALEFRPDAAPERLRQAAGVVRAELHQALEELRELIFIARSEDVTDMVPGVGTEPDTAAGAATGSTGALAGRRPQPQLAHITQLITEVRKAGTVVTFDDRIDDALAVPAGMGRTAYRLVQEGLTNARKHAPGQPVTVTVEGDPGVELRVRVTNPLAAGPAEFCGSGMGLIGLAERIDLAGGRLRHGPTDDGGFELSAWLPWHRG